VYIFVDFISSDRQVIYDRISDLIVVSVQRAVFLLHGFRVENNVLKEMLGSNSVKGPWSASQLLALPQFPSSSCVPELPS
jgi:hypothetical protein